MSSDVENYTKNVLKVVVAQVCQIIGWNSIHQSSLEVLVDTLDRFMQELTKQTYRITELYQRTEPTLDDLALAFHYLNLNLTDIKEYIEYVGPPENGPAIPKYPAAPPQILNVKRLASDDPAAEPSTSAAVMIHPKAEDSEDEEQFLALFQYNREYKTEVAAEDGSVDVKKEDNGEAKASTSTDDPRTGLDSKHDVLKKAAAAARIPPKRKLVAVQLNQAGRIQGVREGRMPGADLPQIFLNEIEAATSLEQQGFNFVDHKSSSKSKSHKHHHDSNGGGSSRSGTPSFPAAAASTVNTPAFSSKREKLPQETDRVKSNIFKKISHPHKHSPQQTFTTATPIVQAQAPQQQPPAPPPPPEVIDIDSSPNPPPIHSPVPQQVPLLGQQQTATAKREKKEKKKKDRVQREQLQHPIPPPDASLLGIPQLPAGTTLEAIPMKVERETMNAFPAGLSPGNPFKPGSAFFPGGPNFSLPQGPGLIPFGALSGNPLIPPIIAGLGSRVPGLMGQLSPKVPAAEHSPKRKEKEPKRLKQQQQAASNVASLIPSNLFLPDTTVRVETAFKQETTQIVQERSPVPVAKPPPVLDNNTIDLLSDDDPAESAIKAATVGGATELDKAAAKKAEKQKKKEQRRLEKLAAAGGGAPADAPMNLSADGEAAAAVVKKEKPSKMERKMEKMLLKKILKSKKAAAGEGAGEGAEEQPIDLSMLDKEKQRKLEKKLKKLQKTNKAKLKAQAEEEQQAQNAASAAAAEGMMVVKKEALLPKSPEPMLLPKLTLKLNSPKVGEMMMHSPKEAAVHASKDYRPLTVDTGDLMTPVKRVKTGSAHSSPLGGSSVGAARQEALPVEPELAKISPLVTRPMKQHHSEVQASPSATATGRGRPKGSTSKSHGSSALPPPVVPIKTEDSLGVSAGGAGGGNQVWICPACGKVDDGSPMIGCDGCDNWYHWLCVGIHVAPESSEDWFCRVCIMQRKEMAGDGLGFADLSARKKEKKKRKKEKKAMKMEVGSD